MIGRNPLNETDLTIRATQTPPSWDCVDGGVFALIAAFGLLQIFLYQRSSDFRSEDVFYFETARSLIQHWFYGFNGRPETNQPPGLPAFLAFLCLIRACSHASFLQAMAVCETLGIAASYAMLRRHMPRSIAATGCVLLMSSPIYFSLGTQWVATSFPLLFTTMSAFLITDRPPESATSRSRARWGALLALLVVASLMIASAAIALLGALVAMIAVTLFRDRRLAWARVKTFVAILLIGVAVEGIWMHRRPAPLEWTLPGYPRPYIQQLKVKSGPNPELGMATLRDIPARMAENFFGQALVMAQLLYPGWINIYWASLVILGPALLILLGLAYSIWQTGGSLQDWYFGGYEVIYLLWPWKTDVRYVLPIAPLAYLYLWRGIAGLALLAKLKPRALGVTWLPLGVLLTLSAWLWERGAWFGRNTLIHGGLQDEVSLVFWLASTVLAAKMTWTGAVIERPTVWTSRWFARISEALRLRPLRLVQIFSAGVLAGLIGTGFAMELQIGRANLHFDSLDNPTPPDVDAGIWVRSHTDPSAIIMARQVPTVYHYAERRVIWFPPSSNPQLLMEGIERYHVEYVIVAKRTTSYYLPSDDDSFAQLQKAYPRASAGGADQATQDFPGSCRK